MKIQNPRSKDQSQKPGEGFKFQDSSKDVGSFKVQESSLKRGANEPSKRLLQAACCEPNLGLAMGQLALRFWGFRRKPLILTIFNAF
jgi:hypothetical protein